MNHKILIIGLIIAFVIGIIFLNLGTQHEDTKNNTAIDSNKNITTSFLNISSNESLNSASSLQKNQDTQKNLSHISKENASIRYENTITENTTKYKNTSPEYKNFTDFITNKRYKYQSKIYFHNTISGNYTKEFNITTYIKEIKTSNGNKYMIIESKVDIPKRDITFHPTNDIPRWVSFKCPPKCEEINYVTWHWDTIEYVDLNNKKAKIIAIPWATHYKIENKTIYQKLERAPDKNITYEYDLSNPDISNVSLLRMMLYDIFEYHPLYLPEFVNYTLQFNTTQKLENNVVKHNHYTGISMGDSSLMLEKLSLDSEKFDRV